MARFLAPEWIDELDRAAGADEALRRATADVHLVVQQEVTGGPDGDAAYHVVVDAGSVAVRPGRAEDPDVTFCQDHATAVAVGRGDLSASAAFMVGRLRVGGDIGLLMAHADAFTDVHDTFAPVRATTEY